MSLIFRRSSSSLTALAIAVPMLWCAGAGASALAQDANAGPGGQVATDLSALGAAGPAGSRVSAQSRSYVVRLGEPSLLEATGLVSPVGAPLPAAAVGRYGAPTDIRPALRPLESDEVHALEVARSGIARRQAPVARAVEAAGAEIVARFETIRNGFIVHAEPDVALKLASLPGVESVSPAPVLSLALARSVPHVGATGVWSDPGFDGSGVTIAVIDTGVDYTHADFGGPGTSDAYRSNNQETVETDSFPTTKIVGGFDLAGTLYTADPDCRPPLPGGWACQSEPTPDDDPLDNHGHGTHVAGIAAGDGVRLGDSAWRIHPGVAPGARIVALKVFGSPRGASVVTDLSDAAIEWVVESNLGMDVPGVGGREAIGKIDVINLSLGATYGSGALESERVVEAAAAAGVTVVASAGNEGNVPFVTGAPGTSGRALSVASTLPPGYPTLSLGADWTLDDKPHSILERALDTGINGQPRSANTGGFSGELAWYGDGCTGTNEPLPAGRVALMEPGICAATDAVRRAEQDGATAVVMIGRTWPIYPMTGVATVGIPGVTVPELTGDALKSALDAGATVVVAVGESPDDLLADTISDFSSRGPGRPGGALKPQISAPGSGIYSARVGTGTGGVALNGTSMAAPMVAGSAAIVRQRATVEGLELDSLDIGALLMNTARPTVAEWRNNEPALRVPIARQGAGRLDVAAAVSAKTVVRSTRGVAEIAFGVVHVTDEVSRTETLLVRNLDDNKRSFSVRSVLLDPEDGERGVSISIDPSQVELGPSGQAEVQVTLHVAPEALTRLDLDRYRPLHDEPRLRTVEADGWILVEELAGPQDEAEQLVVPWHVLPERAGCVELAPGAGDGLRLVNGCGEANVMVYPEIVADPVEPELPAAVDVISVGSRSGAAYERVHAGCSSVVEFVVVTRGPRRLPADGEVQVYLDYDRDGIVDEAVYAFHASDHFSLPTGVWYVGHGPPDTDPESGEPVLAPAYKKVNPNLVEMAWQLDQSATRLPVCADQLQWTGDGSFDYVVKVVDSVEDHPLTETFPGYDLVPETGWLTFDPRTSECLVAADAPSEPALDYAATVPGGGTVTVAPALASGCRGAFRAAVVPSGNAPDNRPIWRVPLLGEGGTQIFLPRTISREQL